MTMETLTPDEIEKAQAIIDKTPPGVYRLSEIYGTEWNSIESKTLFGKRFKQTVKHLTGIGAMLPGTENHVRYEISNEILKR